MHGILPRNLEEKLADIEQSYQWLKFGDIKGEIESIIVADQDQAVPFHSIYDATAASGPLPPSEDASFLLCDFLLPCIAKICDVSVQTTSSHLVFGFPNGFVV